MKYYCVIDFECTCTGDFAFANEIIEFPAILIHPVSLETVHTFHHYVRPTEHPVLTDFCVDLTGITQPQVDSALTLPDVLEIFACFLESENLEILPVTDGPWDFNKFLVPECRRKNLPLPPWCMKFLDLRWKFKQIFRLERWLNLSDMLTHLGLTFEGREHSGIDDSHNIAGILIVIIKAGHSDAESKRHTS
ncbi:putative exoribonuclease [Perkinsus sp. BL_2016]|nr:putative exoribonuclease [Perkinsus sp. BL_2016]